MEYTLMIEKERERTGGSERAAMLVEIRTNVGHCALIVVGSSFHNDSDSVRTVSFIDYLFVIAGIFVGGFFDGAFHRVLWHVGCLGVLHERTQARIG